MDFLAFDHCDSSFVSFVGILDGADRGEGGGRRVEGVDMRWDERTCKGSFGSSAGTGYRACP